MVLGRDALRRACAIAADVQNLRGPGRLGELERLVAGRNAMDGPADLGLDRADDPSIKYYEINSCYRATDMR